MIKLGVNIPHGTDFISYLIWGVSIGIMMVFGAVILRSFYSFISSFTPNYPDYVKYPKIFSTEFKSFNKKDRLEIITLGLSTLVCWLIGWLFVGALVATRNVNSFWWWSGVAIVIIAFFNSGRCWGKRTALIQKKRKDKCC